MAGCVCVCVCVVGGDGGRWASDGVGQKRLVG